MLLRKLAGGTLAALALFAVGCFNCCGGGPMTTRSASPCCPPAGAVVPPPPPPPVGYTPPVAGVPYR